MRSENKQSVDQILLQRQVEETIENINHICCVIAQEKMTAKRKTEVIGQMILINLDLKEMLKTNTNLEASMRN